MEATAEGAPRNVTGPAPATVEAVRSFVGAVTAELAATEDNLAAAPAIATRWVRGTDGHFRPVVKTESPFWAARVSRTLESFPGYSDCLQHLQEDPLIASHLDRLVGTDIMASRLDADTVLWSMIYALLDRASDGSDSDRAATGDARFDREWQRWVAFFTGSTFAYTTVAPLPYLTLPSTPLVLDFHLVLDRLTEDEVTRCCQVGVLTPLPPTFPFITAGIAVGLRVTRCLPKTMRGDNDVVRPPERNVSRFGERAPLLEHELIDDVLAALRLFKSGSLRPAGYASWSDAKMMSGTSFRALRNWPYGGKYSLTESEAPEFVALWNLLKTESSRFEFSLRRFNLAFDRDRLDDRIVDLVIAAESLFLGEVDVRDRTELRFRFALRAAKFVDHPRYGQREIYRIMRRAYDARSAIVHGGSPQDTSLPGHDAANLTDFVSEVEQIVRLALVKALSLRADGARLRKSEFWEDLLFKP